MNVFFMRRRKNGVFDTTVTKPCFRVLRGSQRTASAASVVARSCNQQVAGTPLHGLSVCPGRFTHVIAAAMNAADSRRRAAHVLAGTLANDLAADGSWPVAIERLGAAWPDPALLPLADGMTASEVREQVNGYMAAALGIPCQSASS